MTALRKYFSQNRPVSTQATTERVDLIHVTGWESRN